MKKRFQEQREKYRKEQESIFGTKIRQEPVENIYKIG